MKKLVLSLISSALVASCATPAVDHWQGLETETELAASPLDCGSFPLPDASDPTGMTYTKAGSNKLNSYRQCSEANEAIATEHAQQIYHLKIARKGLTEAGRAQQNIAAMKQEMLEDERKHNFFTKIGYWVVIIGMGVAL